MLHSTFGATLIYFRPSLITILLPTKEDVDICLATFKVKLPEIQGRQSNVVLLGDVRFR